MKEQPNIALIMTDQQGRIARARFSPDTMPFLESYPGEYAYMGHPCPPVVIGRASYHDFPRQQVRITGPHEAYYGKDLIGVFAAMVILFTSRARTTVAFGPRI